MIRAKELWAKYAGVKKDIDQKWNELPESTRETWVVIETGWYQFPEKEREFYMKAYNKIWNEAPGITAENVDHVRMCAFLYAAKKAEEEFGD